MKSFNVFFCLILFIIYLPVTYAKDIDKDSLFKGITEQSHSYTCGGGALSTLITGTVENSHVSEDDIDNAITASKADKEKGYTPQELLKAAQKLGYREGAQWQWVKPMDLAKITQPVILLTGLNSEFSHYVVFEGIENGIAFLADPSRGKLYIPYDELVKEGINDKHPEWFVMEVKASEHKPKDSTLYLSADKYDTHFTLRESALVIMSTVARPNQFIVNYGFSTELGSARNNNLTR